MNRMEAGGKTGGDRKQGVPGATGQANPGAAMYGNTQRLERHLPRAWLEEPGPQLEMVLAQVQVQTH